MTNSVKTIGRHAIFPYPRGRPDAPVRVHLLCTGSVTEVRLRPKELDRRGVGRIYTLIERPVTHAVQSIEMAILDRLVGEPMIGRPGELW